MNAAMLRELLTASHAGRSPHDVHCHQYFGTGSVAYCVLVAVPGSTALGGFPCSSR